MPVIKLEKELIYLREAARITKNIYNKIQREIVPGKTELEISHSIEEKIRKKGLKGSFKTIVASGPNTALPHAKPTTRIIKNNDAVMIDFGVVFKGYCSDLTRMIIVGKLKPELLTLYESVKKAQKFALKTLRPGMQISCFVKKIHDRMRENGLGVYIKHSLGHGVGKKIHEAPKLSERNKRIFRKGMVVTIEPGLYKEGLGGARIEDMVEITKKGVEVLTK
jgi:Xaa-Pro aminopeptidase